ncbi:MAG: polysaccharide biosynthesis/export family protein [Verrucomicrobia bacterium]|nr:polysaccharide biosynthesis/export family protein [Verrucomicrobiota bacterium]
MKTISRNLLLLAMAWAVIVLATLQSWGGDLPGSRSTNVTRNISAASAVKLASSFLLQPDDPVIIRLDTAEGREEHYKTIDEDGNIELPFIGKIKLGRLTIKQAEEAIHKKYVPHFSSYLVVSVFINSHRMKDLMIKTRLGDYWLPGEFEKMLEEKRQEQKQKKE